MEGWVPLRLGGRSTRRFRHRGAEVSLSHKPIPDDEGHIPLIEPLGPDHIAIDGQHDLVGWKHQDTGQLPLVVSDLPGSVIIARFTT